MCPENWGKAFTRTAGQQPATEKKSVTLNRSRSRAPFTKKAGEDRRIAGGGGGYMFVGSIT